MQHLKKRNKLIILILALSMLFVFSCSGAAFADEVTEPEVPVVPTYTFADPGSIGKVTTTALNLRSGPGTDNVALAYIRLNDEVTILENVINELGEQIEEYWKEAEE